MDDRDQHRLRRPYRAGFWIRVVAPVVAAVGLTAGPLLFAVSLWTFLTTDDEIGVAGTAVQAVIASIYVIVIGVAAARQSRVGIWVGRDQLVVRRMWSTSSLPLDSVTTVEPARCGARFIGDALAPCISRSVGDQLCVRHLAEASPLRWGGSTVAEICAAVGRSAGLRAA